MKGSKCAMVKLVESSNFLEVINKLLKESNAEINNYDNWIPKSIKYDKEAELNDFLHYNFDHQLPKDITNWWLYKDATTPNWDLISTCTINGKRGILLVEGKAHYAELEQESKGKTLKLDASDNSKKNHEQIALAITEANTNIKNEIEDITLSRDACYQFSNRVAHAWWLSNQGIPVVLMYLGFLNVEDMSDNYKIFKTDKDWKDCFTEHTKIVGSDALVNKTIECGKSTFTMICKSV
ncbi:hypothetical protein [Flavobacterium sp. GP15]|uniref:hypothetical protein n=1 Tax=Flavobacterium sp. GP15 TaxID=2758567 RepID=UPI00165D37B2|nr:hypothetical protein [Flavobacterium sp. GP15]